MTDLISHARPDSARPRKLRLPAENLIRIGVPGGYHCLALVLAGILPACFFAGCDSGRVEVQGKVTLDGEPCESAFVTFIPEGGGPTGRARTDANGEFALASTLDEPGVVAGQYKVTVSKTHTQGFQAAPDATKEERAKLMMEAMMRRGSETLTFVVPQRYSNVVQTPLFFEVSDDPEMNYFLLSLKTRATDPKTFTQGAPGDSETNEASEFIEKALAEIGATPEDDVETPTSPQRGSEQASGNDASAVDGEPTPQDATPESEPDGDTP